MTGRMLQVLGALLLSVLVPLASADGKFFNGIPSVGVLYDDKLRQHYCTASVVDSKQGNIIITASHCLSTAGTEINFAPGYRNGATPYGTYSVTATYVHPDWNKNYNISVDFAFLTLDKGEYNGRMVNVQEVTGGNKLKINAGYEEEVNIVSYAFKEQRPRQCSSTTYEAQEGQLGIECGPLQSGTSGAAWIANYNPTTKLGDVIGDVGGLHTGGCDDYETFSSKFSQATLDTYNRAVAGGDGDTVRGGAPENCKGAARKVGLVPVVA